MQITLTMDLTAENLDKLKAFVADNAEVKVETKPATKKTAAKKAEPKVENPEPIKVEEPKAEEPKEEAPAAETETITKTDVRAKALALSKAGKSDLLAEIFGKFGASKLSEVKESDYPELMRELVSADA